MKKWRMAAGALLILLAAGGLVYWELQGREEVMFQEVLVTRETVTAGTEISPGLFRTVRIPEEGKMEGALKPEDLEALSGMAAAREIGTGSQITAADFQEPERRMEEGETVFPLKPEWISLRSSSLRQGDLVEIYEDRTRTLIGVYRVAFVKDGNEAEVRDPELREELPILERTDGTGVISHIEILTDMEGYEKIADRTTGEQPAGLLIVQKGEWQ
ncbi:MAG: SAF domain-containing protein [Bacillota bacterium]|nr:SAF domain-containing protein [Bacillota bacterium]